MKCVTCGTLNEGFISSSVSTSSSTIPSRQFSLEAKKFQVNPLDSNSTKVPLLHHNFEMFKSTITGGTSSLPNQTIKSSIPPNVEKEIHLPSSHYNPTLTMYHPSIPTEVVHLGRDPLLRTMTSYSFSNDVLNGGPTHAWIETINPSQILSHTKSDPFLIEPKSLDPFTLSQSCSMDKHEWDLNNFQFHDPESTPYYQPLSMTLDATTTAQETPSSTECVKGSLPAQRLSGTLDVLPPASRHNHAIRLVYADDHCSLIPANHNASPCRDPMILCGRLVDMSVHMEMYLQDLLPRKGTNRLNWQPVDITFDILSSRLKGTLEVMEKCRAEMTLNAIRLRSLNQGVPSSEKALKVKKAGFSSLPSFKKRTSPGRLSLTKS